MIQGVATIVTASVPTLDENIDIKALLECAVILNGMYCGYDEYNYASGGSPRLMLVVFPHGIAYFLKLLLIY